MRKRTLDMIVLPVMLLIWLAMGLGLLLGVAGPCILHKLAEDDYPATPTAATLQVLWAGLGLYRADTGSYPPDLGAVKAFLLRENIPVTDDSFFDEWNRPIRYSLQQTADGQQAFTLFSTGANGKNEHDQPGRGDDIAIDANGEIIGGE